MALGVLKNLFADKELRGSIPYGPDHPVYNDDLAGMVNDEYKRRQSERMPFELQWRLNLEFIKGNQFVEINPVSQSIDEIPKLYWYQEREVFNQIGTIYETRTARITRQKPSLKVRPSTGSDRDVSAAKVSSMLLNYSWNEQGMNEKYTEFVSWLEAIGTCFWKPVWNVKKGRIVSVLPSPPADGEENKSKEDEIRLPDTYAPLFDQGSSVVEIREGDIDTVCVTAFEIYPDSNFRHNLEQCRSVIHARAYHVDEIFDMFGQHVEPEEVDVITLQSGRSGLGGLGYAYGMFRHSSTKIKNHAIVKEYYERPSRKYPHGRLIIVAGSKTLYVGTLPYMLGSDGTVDFPLVRTTCLDNPGMFWGKTVVERLIPIQRRYNALRNRKAEYLNLVAIGQWYEPINSLLEDVELNNAPGNRIRYRPGPNGEKPTPVQFPSLPASFENEESSLMAEFTAISGVSELSRYSEAPSGVKSGIALSIANEQDDTRIANTTQRIANGIITLGKYWLRLYRQFVREPRILRWVGPNREVDVREWFVSDLKSDDVVIENVSALSETPSQRRQMIFDLIGTGIFNRDQQNPFDEDGRQKIMQLLEMGHWEYSVEDDRFLQKTRARLENSEMLRGVPRATNDFDDHALHIEMHNRQRMQEEYEQILKTPMGSVVDQLMRAHIAEHMNALIQAQMAQQQQQIQMQMAAAAGVASAVQPKQAG